MARTTKKRVKLGFLAKLLLLVMLAALSWQLYRLHSQVADAAAQKEQLSAQVQEQQQKNDTLEDGIKNDGSQEEMEKIARNDLGLVSPGEKVFYDVSN